MPDEHYMYRCFQLALLGAGNVAPNPMVGAVLVYKDRIIGEGYHQQYGEAHAEVNCIRNVPAGLRSLIPASTLYVSLEPCAHFGKTPPCADLVIHEMIPRVVIGCTDVFAQVAGRGIQKLQDAGIEVVVGVLREQALELNKRFFTFHTAKRPFIILKWAQSADHKISAGTDERLLISNEISNRQVHKWRSEETAILVGTRTALLDNPSLTTRHWGGSNPIRLVIDKRLQLPNTHQLMDKKVRTIIFNSLKNSNGETEFRQVKNETDFLSGVLRELYTLNIQSVLVEGGATLLQSFIDAGLWDEARVITNQGLMIGAGLNAPELGNLQPVSQATLETDQVSYYRNNQLIQ
ncbi:MAG: bifunctional diaminohydroxyphosphoribosylaminopyrimidine deaminase/5-amino-6-(5-phosphoribosylamino)uracil reductase RibD [Bacteroidota bacterium]